jgi:soluble lytic murein transglycosylase
MGETVGLPACPKVVAFVRSWRVTASLALGLAAAAPGLASATGFDFPYYGEIPAFGRAETAVPSVLRPIEALRYGRIFLVQEKGDWSLADREIAALGDRRLMGHVLAQRFLHPKWRSSYAELTDWLANYADHPHAPALHRLATARTPKGQTAPKPLVLPKVAVFGTSDFEPVYRSAVARDDDERRRADQLRARIDARIKAGDLDEAAHLLSKADGDPLLDEVEFDRERAAVAAAFYAFGNDKQAYRLAAAAANRSRAFVTAADWTAGLAAWRLGDMTAAQRHFEALARSETASSWKSSAGAYWASRAFLRGRKPTRVNEMLALASRHPHTFYGMLANRQLGRQSDFGWDAPPLSAVELSELMRIPGVVRAIALAEAGAFTRADLELGQAYRVADGRLAGALLGLASRIETPSMQLRLAGARGVDGRRFDAALFPIPPWEPEGGFSVDRALIYGFMRQESGFRAGAKSHAGAHGLMQIMPKTASFIEGDATYEDAGKSRLLAPRHNMALGQKYLAHLLDDDSVRGNLFMLAAAYNAGPGTLKRWLKTVKFDDDPLLFIESIPSRETRIFIERVVANFWIYRERLNQDSPSLDAVAVGLWPYYVALDGATMTVARHAQN